MIGNMGLLKFFTLCKEKIEENEFLYNTNKFDIMTIQSADLNTEYFGVLEQNTICMKCTKIKKITS